MSFLKGRASFVRFEVDGHKPDSFSEEQLSLLADHAIGHQRHVSADGVEVGWIGGRHILDKDFDLEKNIVSDALCFELRVDSHTPPGDLLKAYFELELKALSADNPSGFPSAKQKQEAREIARERIEEEAKDGRFRKSKAIPVLWERSKGELWFGSTSSSHIDRLCSLFRETFTRELRTITAGRLASSLYTAIGGFAGSEPELATPSIYVEHVTPDDYAWIVSEQSRDFLGNEFLIWLWFLGETDADTIRLIDTSEATFMIARTLALDCPRGESGHDTISHEGPSRLPEAKRAIQSGKLPRKLGLTLVRHDRQYELTLGAETFGVGGLKLPDPTEENPRAKLEERIDNLRHAVETLDGMYSAFLAERTGPRWGATLTRIQKWLKK